MARAPRPLSLAVQALAALLLLGAAAPAAAQVLPLQVDVTTSLPTGAKATTRFQAPIESGGEEPGLATLSGIARNLRGGAVQVSLAFRYKLPADMIGLDELIERIEISTETPEGDVFFDSMIDTKLIPLNPNRTPLFYRATLYHPEEGQNYVIRVRVFGNYE